MSIHSTEILIEPGASFGFSGPCVKNARVALDRARAPEETLLRAVRVAAQMGVTRVANLTGLDRVGIPVVAVTRPNSRSVAVALGKGYTLAAAKASGLMEAIESYHAENAELPLLLSSYESLERRERVQNVLQLPRVSMGTFRPTQRLLWTRGRELIRDREHWVPYEVVHTDYTLPFQKGSGAFLMSSNGLASGNHQLEATSHGICEVVERDATALWQGSGRKVQLATRLSLESIDDEPCRLLLEKFQAASVDARVWDTTSDIGIPCFRCEVSDEPSYSLNPLHPVAGYGCHPRREVALMRALTEAAQGRLTLIAGARDDLSQSLFQTDQVTYMLNESSRQLDANKATRRFDEVPTYNASTVEEDVEWELKRLASVGLDDVTLVDLTKAEFSIPVVRVIIPGLESLSEVPGYLPGARLRRRREQSR